ncbi:hypothetical protein F2P81_007779 [Scophthalmus maximus]|uniref:RRM domain-containing protein n=1 Tax=Scophthalmus maximus TaxID=52904 RepID=A0A6A4T8Q7_SCOMX|nr:hypothetical protein F2P81_007779 [Scophthalmus maximus]
MGDYGFGVLVKNSSSNKSAFPVRIPPHLQPQHPHHPSNPPSPPSFVNNTCSTNGGSAWLFSAVAQHGNMQDEILESDKSKALDLQDMQEKSQVQTQPQALSPGQQEAGGVLGELEGALEDGSLEKGSLESSSGKEKLRMESPVLSGFDYQDSLGMGTSIAQSNSSSSSLTSFNNWSPAVPSTQSPVVGEDVGGFFGLAGSNGNGPPLLFQNFSHHAGPGFGAGGSFSPQIGPVSQHHAPTPHPQHYHPHGRYSFSHQGGDGPLPMNGHSSLFPMEDERSFGEDESGDQGLPGLGSAHCFPHLNGERVERYSRKVFVGGLPPDIDEDEITASFRRFGHLFVDWPHKAESKSYFPPKGYAFLLFQDESSVQALIDACIQEDGKLYLCVSSPTIKDKPVQIRPWNLNDSDFVMDGSQPLDPRKTIFVGGVPRPLRAVELAMIMDRLYGGVCYAGIDTDPELKYPKGAGRVAFSNQQSYIAAISARFVQLQHGEIDKRVEVKPYVLDDQLCDECQGTRCGGKFAPFFCANVTCLQYYFALLRDVIAHVSLIGRIKLRNDASLDRSNSFDRDEPQPQHAVDQTEPRPRCEADKRGNKRVRGEKTRSLLKVKLPKINARTLSKEKATREDDDDNDDNNDNNNNDTPSWWTLEPAESRTTTVSRVGGRRAADTDADSVGGDVFFFSQGPTSQVTDEKEQWETGRVGMLTALRLLDSGELIGPGYAGKDRFH